MLLKLYTIFIHVSLQTPAAYLEKYNKKRGNEYSKFHGYAFDGIWVIAKAFDRLARKRKRRHTPLVFTREEVTAALNATNFLGVTVSIVLRLVKC